jgi:hypothetical protein
MFSKSNLISTIVTAIWAYFGGWLLWGLLMDATLKEHLVTSGLIKDIPDMLHLILGSLVVTFCFSNIYGKWSQGNFGISTGVVFGIWIGVLVGLGLGLVNLATMNYMDSTGTFLDTGIYLVFFGIMGLLAGIVYQKTSSTPS